MAILTTAREAVWTAIDNWPSLKREDDTLVFQTTYRFSEDDELQKPSLVEVRPSISDLPALAIYPVNVVPQWWTNQNQQLPYFLQFSIFTQDWWLEEPENLYEEVVKAVYRAKPEPGGVNIPSYVKTACGYDPLRNGPVTFSRIKLESENGPRITQVDFQIALRLTFNPLNGA